MRGRGGEGNVHAWGEVREVGRGMNGEKDLGAVRYGVVFVELW
ncbi:hypothetical protein [Bartonella rattaustraliani]|nr:hypothetical protein [Bartonella rattaustraliani]